MVVPEGRLPQLGPEVLEIVERSLQPRAAPSPGFIASASASSTRLR